MLKFEAKSAVAAIKSVLTAAKQAQQDMQGSIADIRQRIAVLQKQRADVLRAPVSQNVAEDRLSIWLDELVDGFVSTVRYSPNETHTSGPPPIRDFVRSPDIWKLQAPSRHVNMVALLATYLKNDVLSAMLAELSEQYRSGLNFIEEGERRDQLELIDQQILDAELAEEAIIRAAARNGIVIPRRKDASTAVLQASDEQLP